MIIGLGKRIQNRRKENSLTQEELAKNLGVARQTISKWECDETSPDLNQAVKLAKVFRVSLDELVGNKLDDIYLARISNTERLAGLIIKMLKVMGVIFYFIILAFLIAIMIYYFRLSKIKESKDYTKEYQTDFSCEYEGLVSDYSARFDGEAYILEYCNYDNIDNK